MSLDSKAFFSLSRSQEVTRVIFYLFYHNPSHPFQRKVTRALFGDEHNDRVLKGHLLQVSEIGNLENSRQGAKMLKETIALDVEMFSPSATDTQDYADKGVFIHFKICGNLIH